MQGAGVSSWPFRALAGRSESAMLWRPSTSSQALMRQRMGRLPPSQPVAEGPGYREGDQAAQADGGNDRHHAGSIIAAVRRHRGPKLLVM